MVANSSRVMLRLGAKASVSDGVYDTETMQGDILEEHPIRSDIGEHRIKSIEETGGFDVAKAVSEARESGMSSEELRQKGRELYRQALEAQKASEDTSFENEEAWRLKQQARAYRMAADEMDGGAGAQHSLSRDINGETFVDVTEDILDVSNGESVARTIQKIIADRFNNLINANGQNIQINKTTNDEFRRSESANRLLKNPSQTYNDKLRTIANADEILTAAKNWIGEERDHDRKDDIVEFGRGNVTYRVGENGYVADVLVGIRKNGAAVLYDLVNIYDKKITEAPVTMASQNDSQRRQKTSVADIIPQKEDAVNREYSLSADSDGKQLSEGQREYFKDSKVVDADGRLLKVYHGTNEDFNVFDFSRTRKER